MPIRWDDLAGAVYHGPVGQSGDAVDNPQKVETGLTRVDQDLFYDPNDQELDDHISQSIADGFNPLDFIEALPEAFYNIASEALSTIAKIPQAELSKAPGTALEAILRAGTDTGDLLMRIGSGVSMMGLKIAPGEAAAQYHKLPESLKSVARGYWRTQRSIEQRRARQMMGDANYNFLPSQLVDQNLAEGLSMFLDPTMYFSFGASTGLKSLAKTAAKRNVVSRGLINVAMKTGQMQDALINKAQRVATSPARLGLAVAKETSAFVGEGIQQVKERFPKKTTGEPVQVDLPTEGKIGFIRKGIAGAVSYGEDAMELASEIKRQSARRNMPGVLDRIARDTSVRSGARNMASVLESMGANPVVRGLVVPGYKVGAAVAEGATVGGMLGLLTFDEEFAANSLAGGALFGPVGKLAGGVIGYPEKNRQQVDNFIDDFKAKLEPEDLANFEEWTGGNRDDAKFFASLSYMFKNGHFKKGEGNLDIRFLNGEQYRAYGERQRERFGETAGVNFISSEGRNTVLINTDKKRTNRDTLAHELGHAIMKLPEVQDAISTQDKLLFGDYNVTIKDGKEVLDYNFEGLLSKEWINTFFDNYVNSLDESIRPQYRTLKDEQKFMIARDEIYADSMREFFGKFNPDSFIKAGKINTLKFKIGGSYQRNAYEGLGGSLARGIIGNVLMARNSMGLYAVRNIGRSLGLIKKDEPIVLRDGRVFSNIADMLQKRRENIIADDDPVRDTIGTRWNLSELNSKDSREVASSFLPTAPVQRGEDGLPIRKNGRYQFQNKTQRKKADNERAAALTDAVDSTANSGETIKSLTPFQKLENGHYRGDFIPQATISAIQGTSKRVVTPHNLDNIMRINDRMKDRPKDSGTLLEFTYNQVKEDGKKTPDIITSYRQMAPMVFDMSKNGKNFSITGIDLNDLMTRLERFEMSPSETERGKVFDIWRDEYKKLQGKPEDITLDKNPVRELFLQDLWLYLSGMSEGKSGIEALGGKGHTGEQLMSVTRKRDGLMRFLGFQKKDQLLTNENMFQQLVDKNSIIKSYRLDRLQNLSISDRKNMQVTMGAHLAAQYNLAPGTLYSFKGSGEGKSAQAANQQRSAIDIFENFDNTLKEIEAVKPGKPTMYELANYLAERSSRAGKLDEMTEANSRALGDTIFEEASAALAKDADAVGWYDRKIDEAMGYLYEMHPELKDDAGLDSLFKSFIAVTSNGQDVRSNFKRANYLYENYKKTGKILTDSGWGGQNKDAINAGLKNLDDLISDLGGLNEARAFLMKSITVRDLNKFLAEKGINKLTGELADHTVLGAMIFGPKIGSFYGNLNKLFDSVTMDRWFMRTINRIRGTLVDAPKGVASQAKELASVGQGKLPARVASQLKKLMKDFEKPGFKGIKAYPALQKFLKTTYREVEKRRFKNRSELEKRAQRLHIYLKSVNEAPSNGSERAWIRTAMAHAQARLKAEKNIDISNADLQAVMWYWEKDLYQGLNVGNKRAERADYADAARELFQQGG